MKSANYIAATKVITIGCRQSADKSVLYFQEYSNPIERKDMRFGYKCVGLYRPYSRLYKNERHGTEEWNQASYGVYETLTFI